MNLRIESGLLPLLALFAACASTGGPGALAPGCEAVAWDAGPLEEVLDPAATLAAIEQAWTPPAAGGVIQARLVYDTSGVFREARVAPGGVDPAAAERLEGILGAAVRPDVRARRGHYLELGDAAGSRLQSLGSVVNCAPRVLDGATLDRRTREAARSLDLPDGSQVQVVLRLSVGEDGEVVEGEVFQSAGRVDVDRAALDLLRLARFSPASIGGFPIPVWIAVPVTFTAPSDRD